MQYQELLRVFRAQRRKYGLLLPDGETLAVRAQRRFLEPREQRAHEKEKGGNKAARRCASS